MQSQRAATTRELGRADWREGDLKLGAASPWFTGRAQKPADGEVSITSSGLVVRLWYSSGPRTDQQCPSPRSLPLTPPTRAATSPHPHQSRPPTTHPAVRPGNDVLLPPPTPTPAARRCSSTRVHGRPTPERPPRLLRHVVVPRRGMPSHPRLRRPDARDEHAPAHHGHDHPRSERSTPPPR